jgi:hypothetical protein
MQVPFGFFYVNYAMMLVLYVKYRFLRLNAPYNHPHNKTNTNGSRKIGNLWYHGYIAACN